MVPTKLVSKPTCPLYERQGWIYKPEADTGQGNSQMLRIVKWLREPLLHFVLLGSALFWLAGGGLTSAEGDIVVTTSLKKALAADFERKHGVVPNADQLTGLISTWVEDEMLYREAKKLGLDESDPVMRRRLIQSMRFLAEDEAAAMSPTRQELESVLEKNPDVFQVLPTVTFEHVFFKKGKPVPSSMSKLLDGLRSGDSTIRGDPFIHGRDQVGLTRPRIHTLLGESFADAVFELKPGQWHGPITSSFGEHLVLLKERTQGEAPALDAVANQVQNVWRNNKRNEALTLRLEALEKVYRVVEESAPQ